MSQNNNKIYSKEKSSYWVLIIVGVVFILSLLLTYEETSFKLEQKGFEEYFPFIFPLIGLICIVYGVNIRQKVISIGLMPVTLSPAIGQVGGQIGGHIELKQAWRKREFNLTLSCLHTYSTGNEEETSTRTDIVWQHSSFPVDKPYQQGSILEFCFDVKDDLPVNGSYMGKGNISWELLLEGTINDNDIKRHWTIPVEKGNDLSTIVIPKQHTLSEKEIKLDQATKSINEQVNIQLNNDELYLASESGGTKRKGSTPMIAGAIFFAAGLFLFREALQGQFMLWIMAPIFSAVGLALFGFGIFLKGRKLETKIRGEQVFVRRTLFGRILYKHQGALNSANQINLSQSSSSQQGSKRTETMVITAEVTCEDNKTRQLKLVEGIKGHLAGETMQKQIFDYMKR